MRTRLNLDDELLAEAMKLGQHASADDAVNAALRKYVAHLKRLRIIDLFGTVDYDPNYDYKAERWRKR